MFKRIGRIALAVVLAGLVTATPKAATAADADLSVWRFNGFCVDCTEAAGEAVFATAILTLSGYNAGDDLANSNFVSFEYEPTNLLTDGFSVNLGNFNSLSGALYDTPLTSQSWMRLSFNTNEAFRTHNSEDGQWEACVGDWVSYCYDAQDYGNQGTWTLLRDGEPNVVPEPGTYALVAAGMGMLIAFRRRSRTA